jgi:hypothetical protein
VKTYRGGIFQNLFQLDPSRVVRVIDASQVLLERGTALIQSIRPGVEQGAVLGIVTGCTPGGERLLALPGRVAIVAIRAGESAAVRIRRSGPCP